ncbi:MAG: hypothetical protein ACPG7E_03570, partial [Marinirhabdus sp.]
MNGPALTLKLLWFFMGCFVVVFYKNVVVTYFKLVTINVFAASVSSVFVFILDDGLIWAFDHISELLIDLKLLFGIDTSI